MSDPSRVDGICRACLAVIPYVPKRTPKKYCSRTCARQHYKRKEQLFRMHNFADSQSVRGLTGDS